MQIKKSDTKHFSRTICVEVNNEHVAIVGLRADDKRGDSVKNWVLD